MSEYTTTIGLEIHAELKTASKMFCGCTNDPHHGEPNTHTCPICMGHPGTLPTINKEAVKHVLKVGVALGGDAPSYSEFDRKNYFYPDIPKGYQISQYAYPFVSGGELAGVAIERVHLEEDTARSQHDQGDGSLVDYNRASVPLMELVTKPVMHSAEEAGRFARELQLLLRTLGVSDANMEKGEMRVEVNISVSKSDTLGTKVEVKNINSFKAAEAAIRFEEKRQIKELEAGNSITQETRGWDENRDKTVSQRSKETADDYRYFPDPDLPKLDINEITEFNKSRLAEELPELPEEKRLKYNDLGLTSELTEVIISNQILSPYFIALTSEVSDGGSDFFKMAANYLTSDVLGYMQDQNITVLPVAHTEGFSKLIKMAVGGEISSRVAKDLLPEVVFEGADPEKLAQDRGLTQQNDAAALMPVIESIVAEHTSVADEYRGGKESVIQFFVGQGMKATKGAANPAVLKELFEAELSK